MSGRASGALVVIACCGAVNISPCIIKDGVRSGVIVPMRSANEALVVPPFPYPLSIGRHGRITELARSVPMCRDGRECLSVNGISYHFSAAVPISRGLKVRGSSQRGSRAANQGRRIRVSFKFFEFRNAGLFC